MNIFIKKILYLFFIILIICNLIVNNSYAHEQYQSDESMMLKLFLREQISSKVIGDSIFFGNYEQDGIIEDDKEPVEWIILMKDTNDDSAILISKYILDCYPFNGFKENVNWDNCSLRKHMNTAMLNEMFNSIELSCLLPTYLLNSKNIFNGAYSGEPTYDYLFIPGIDEMVAFYSNDNFVNQARIDELLRPNIKRVCFATPYAKIKGVRVLGVNTKYPGAGNYLLRTSAPSGRRLWFGDVYADYFQTFVSEDGAIRPDGTGINSADDGIRPMVQISY